MTFGERFKSIKGSLSREDFAKKINVDKSTIHNYLNGHIPKGDVLQRIRQEFKVSIDWLLSGEGNPYIEEEDREVFKARGIELQDGEGLYGKTHLHEVRGTPPFTITEFKPKDGQAQGPLLAAITGLSEIFDSKDSILIPSIQANIRAFQISARREHDNAQQARQIKALQDECDELKKRFDAHEKDCKINS